jgi:hypothetical protein
LWLFFALNTKPYIFTQMNIVFVIANISQLHYHLIIWVELDILDHSIIPAYSSHLVSVWRCSSTAQVFLI